MSGLAICAGCGCDWFTFVGRRENAGYPDDAVQLDEQGHVVAYAGLPVCARCGQQWIGEAWTPKRFRPSLVPATPVPDSEGAEKP